MTIPFFTTLAIFAFPATSELLEPELTDKQAKENEERLLSRSRKLTFAGNRSGEGYFSADGKKLIYQSERIPENPFYQIYVLDLETGDTNLVSTGSGKTTCSWLHPVKKKALFPGF